MGLCVRALQSTVWPEVNKLLGHPNEMVCMAANSDGSVIATACKVCAVVWSGQLPGLVPSIPGDAAIQARDARAAVVFLWETTRYSIIQRLEGHSLSVLQMEFSPDNKYLLTVSKDRQFCLFQKADDSARLAPYALLATVKAHRRVIWSCSWSTDGTLFATGTVAVLLWQWSSCGVPASASWPWVVNPAGARDQTAKIWAVRRDAGATVDAGAAESPDIAQISTVNTWESAVTAVAFAPGVAPDGGYTLAVGLETGAMELWRGVRTGDGACLFVCVLMLIS